MRVPYFRIVAGVLVGIFLVGLAARTLFPVEVKVESTVYVSRPDPQLVSCATLPAVIWQDEELRLVATADSADVFVTDSGYRLERRSELNALGDRCWVPHGFVDSYILLGLRPFESKYAYTHMCDPLYELTMASIPQSRAVILAISNCEATRVRR